HKVMKLNFVGVPLWSTQSRIPKIVVVMKRTALLLLSIRLQVSADVNAQAIDYSKRHAAVEEVFRVMRKQTGYEFLYNNSVLEKAQKQNLIFKNTPRDQVLTSLFKDQSLTYSIIGKTIVVKEREQPLIQTPTPKQALAEIKGIVTDSISG